MLICATETSIAHGPSCVCVCVCVFVFVCVWLCVVISFMARVLVSHIVCNSQHPASDVCKDCCIICMCV
jgi:hypothetical protein